MSTRQKQSLTAALSFTLFMLLASCTSPYQKDLNAVRAILEANGMGGKDPERYGRMKSDNRITKLDFHNCSLKTIPADIGVLSALDHIDLSYNQLVALPAEIGNLTNAKIMDLQGNKLKYLPESIGNCTSLTKLYLQANELDTLPYTIGRLVNLEEFDIFMNKLTRLPDSIGNLKKLGILMAYENLLTDLPDGMVGMQLGKLNVQHNRIKNFPMVVLMTSIGDLEMSFNPLDTSTVPVDLRRFFETEYYSDSWKDGLFSPLEVYRKRRLKKQ